MKEVFLLIDEIEEQYKKASYVWKVSSLAKSFNMKKIRVQDIYQKKEILNYIDDYLYYLNEFLDLSSFFDDFLVMFYKSKITTRVKAKNSVQFKLERFMHKKEKGKVSLNKCLNDLFGIRIILENDFSFKEMQESILKKFLGIKCIYVKREEYEAIHVYFGKEDNQNFQWELQIWKFKQAKGNFISHQKYKQDYAVWEFENKEGDKI